MPLPFICIRRIETGHERVYVSILLAFFIHIVAALFLYVFFIKPYSGCMAIESLWVRVDVAMILFQYPLLLFFSLGQACHSCDLIAAPKSRDNGYYD